MADASFVQSSFLGGEWSVYAQGRLDLPAYRTALATCVNAFPVEEGACTRRPGFFRLGPTLSGLPAVVKPLYTRNGLGIYLEMSVDVSVPTSYLRIWVPDNTYPMKWRVLPSKTLQIAAISTDTPAIVETTTAHGLTTGLTVDFQLNQSASVSSAPQLLRGAVFSIVVTSTTQFAIYGTFSDSPIDGSALNYSYSVGDTVSALQAQTLPYQSMADLYATRVVPASDFAVLLNQGYAPQLLNITNNTASVAPAEYATTLEACSFQNTDGPYLDPLPGNSQTGNSLGQVASWYDSTYPTGWNALTDVVFSCTDGAYTFSSADVGRAIRLWTQPQAYQAGQTYGLDSTLSLCTYNGAFYICWYPNLTNVAPGSPYQSGGVTYTPWLPAPNAGQWVYGYITAVNEDGTVNVTLQDVEEDTSYPNSAAYRVFSYQGATPSVVDTWQLGAYIAGQYPARGTYHEGRLWLGGAIPNRMDATFAGALTETAVAAADGVLPPLSFSPTDVFGNVPDDSAISETLDAIGNSDILWIIPDHQGILIGMRSGEWLITASSLNDPLTPTSIQAHQNTSFRSFDADPVRAGIAVMYIQANGRRVIEYLADVFSGKFVGRHLNEYAQHAITAGGGAQEICYQEDRAPILWVRTTNGSLVGCTYRRVSGFATEPPVYSAWHRHELGDDTSLLSICVGSDPTGTLDQLTAVLKDSAGLCTVAAMAPLFEEDDLLPEAMHLDGAIVPVGTDDPSSGPPVPGPPGKYYLEVTLNSISTAGYAAGINLGIGFAAPTIDLSGSFAGGAGNPDALTYCPCVFYSSGGTYTGGETQSSAGYMGVVTNGDVIGICIDTVNMLSWAKNITTDGGWNSPNEGDPVAETEGSSLTAIPPDSNVYFVISGYYDEEPLTVTVNFGASEFAGTVPTGYAAWDATGSSVMASSSGISPLTSTGLEVTSGTDTTQGSLLSNTMKAQG